MWKSGTQSLELSQKTVGLVWDNPKSYPNKEVKVWNVKHKMYEYDFGELDFSKIFSDHLKTIPNGCCRECYKPIQDYPEKFYAKKTQCSVLTSILYSSKNGYCRECAIKLGSIYSVDTNPLEVVKHEEMTYGTCCHTVTKDYYNDGSVVEYDSENVLTKGHSI